MLKKTVETLHSDTQRATIIHTYTVFGKVLYTKTVEKALYHLFPAAKF